MKLMSESVNTIRWTRGGKGGGTDVQALHNLRLTGCVNMYAPYVQALHNLRLPAMTSVKLTPQCVEHKNCRIFFALLPILISFM